MEKYTLLLVLISIAARSIGQESESDQVVYYENLIETNQNAAFHYNSPTNADEYRPKTNASPIAFGTFDFIIIGAGSAGAVIANRLTEIAGWSVLLVEAGCNETDFSNIPGEHLYLQGSPMNWNYNTTPQSTACLGMENQRCSIPRGKVLGGSSSINGLVYSRGNKRDYDGWAALGNKGWSYSDVLPYFIKSENSQIDGDPGYHGKGGYWNVEYHRPISQQLKSFINAYKEIYNSTPVDYNGKQESGMFIAQLSNIHGTRDSTNKAFLTPFLNRPNLNISRRSYVTKIIIQNKTAIGIEFAKNQVLYHARARKEVIVSGGSIASPQILQLSGIGPKKLLNKVGIPVVQNLQVGQGLKDHPCFFGLYISTNVVEPVVSLKKQVSQYLEDYGPLSIALNSQGVGFYHSNYSKPCDAPDIEFEFMPSNSTSPYLQRSLKVTDETYNALWSNVDTQTSFNVYLVGLHPESVGTVTLQSNDPYLYPLINPRYLSDAAGKDIDIMYQALLILQKHLETEAMRKINASIVYADYPQCRNYSIGSRGYWYCAFRLLTAHLYHPIATCKMGPDPKKGAVVDSKLRVHGIHNLRVADASVVPLTLSGHTGAPSVMIGEKISDLIKLDYGQKIEPITNAF